MKKKSNSKLIIALIAVLLIVGIYFFWVKFMNPGNEQEPTVTVIAASQNIPQYKRLNADVLVYKQIPQSAYTPDMVTDANKVIGYISLVEIPSGQIILSNVISQDQSTNGGLSVKVPDGFRAMSVGVSDVSGVSSLLKVGNRVDVIFVTKEFEKDFTTQNSMSQRSVATMLLEDIEVLALDQALIGAPTTSDGVNYYSTVTLAIRPEDTVKMALAFNEGSVYLALRSPTDDSTIGPVMFELNDLFGKTEE